MDYIALVAAFGGGVFGAIVGALPAFILTGIFAIGGSLLQMAGVADTTLGFMTFGSFLGPHIAFAGGVAAAAFAANKKKVLDSGTDITSALYGTGDPMTLIVGGVFGIFGFLVCHLYGNVLGLDTDLPGMTVFTSAVVVRLLLGKSGIVGKFEGSGKREWFPTGSALIMTLLLGLGYGLAVAGVGQVLTDAGAVDMGGYVTLVFGLSATSLIFTQCGFAVPGSHYITLPTAAAFVGSGSFVIGVVIALICALLGDVAGRVFNSHCDTHIDPPATTIFIMMFIINAIW